MEYEVTHAIEDQVLNKINLKLVTKFLKRIKHLTIKRQENYWRFDLDLVE